jgi:DNA-binding NarL/FixJ family response regulator
MAKILIIEDDTQTRENLSLILEMEGFDVVAAADGPAGIAAVERENPELVLCDVSMPGLDGYEVLRRLRLNPGFATLPFIFLTARGERQDQRKGMNLGADDYLCKPCETDELLQAMRVRLERSRTSNAALPNADWLTTPGSARPLESLGLTPREAEVLLWIVQGKANSDIGVILGMSEKTVKIHVGHILEKLNVENRTSAARCALEQLSRTRSTFNS